MTDPLQAARNNWRIITLVVLLTVSAYFLFVPSAPISGGAADAAPNQTSSIGHGDDAITNLQYGIELDGGARVTAPVVGMHVSEAGVNTDNQNAVRQEVAAAMDIDEGNVRTFTQDEAAIEDSGDFPAGTVEVRERGEAAEFVEGLQNAGLDVSEGDVDDGVTSFTRSDIVEVLDTRLGESGFSGGSVTQSRGGGEPRIAVEAPGGDIEQVKDVIRDRGEVLIIGHVPDSESEEGFRREVLLRDQDVTPGTVSRVDGEPGVPMTLTSDAAERMAQFMRDTGFANQPLACNVAPGQEPGPTDWCIMTTVDDEIIRSAGIRPDLAESFQTGEFEQSQSYRSGTSNFSEAQELRLNLIAGELPAELDLDRSNEFLFSPELAEGFKTNSLLTGILAVFMVVLMVFLRYGEPRVAAPMAATALSELVILLGFAAAIGWPLDLAVVAGFIAVVGTGVDDLIIIADEVMSEGEVKSHHVFDSRFKKAFWIIGAAAATTIIAMSPLAILDLGELRGFAIVTILGVLIGVGITRPAYGNILRSLKTEGR